MKQNIIKIGGVFMVTFLPTLAFAACTTEPGTLQDIVCKVTDIGATYIVPILTLLAFVYFLWRVLKFIQQSANSAKQTENRESLIWSIVGLTVMVSIWGIVAIVGTTFGIDSGFVPQVKPPLTKSGWTGYTGGGNPLDPPQGGTNGATPQGGTK